MTHIVAIYLSSVKTAAITAVLALIFRHEKIVKFQRRRMNYDQHI